MSAACDLPPKFGKYHILRKLDAGGMGTVYLADDTLMRRRVALKVPHFDADREPQIRERFLREARSVASIKHEHICLVYELGEIGGTHYLTMEYIEGTPLEKRVVHGQPWEPRVAVELLRKLALAVQVLHNHKVIHRDLKPKNVMLRPNGEPVLLDFGLARPCAPQSQELTATGTVVGTPAYMSPEQIRGDKEIGPATDVYSLGVILYELLTGERPFPGPSFAELSGQILYGKLDPPSGLRPDLEPALDALCMKAMARQVAQRFATAQELAAALAAYLQRSAPPSPKASVPAPVKVPAGSALPQSAQDTPTHGGVTDPRVNQRSVPARSGRRSTGRLLLLGGLAAGILLLALLGLLLLDGWNSSEPGGQGPEQANQEKEKPPLGTEPKGTVLPIPGGPPQLPGKPSNETVTVDLGEGLTMTFARIPAKGRTFVMGSSATESGRNPVEKEFDAEQQVRVNFTRDYWMAIHETTQAQYTAITGKMNPSWFSAKGKGANRLEQPETGNFPVEQVSWFECHACVEKLNDRFAAALAKKYDVREVVFSLPTEAQWEYACREGGGEKANLPFYLKGGPTASLSSTQANFDGNQPYGAAVMGPHPNHQRTTVVGSYGPNRFGLFDMHGNVWEWCTDHYGHLPGGDDAERFIRRNNDGRRVVRGGAWNTTGASCRAAARDPCEPDQHVFSVGFRVVLRLEFYPGAK